MLLYTRKLRTDKIGKILTCGASFVNLIFPYDPGHKAILLQVNGSRQKPLLAHDMNAQHICRTGFTERNARRYAGQITFPQQSPYSRSFNGCGKQLVGAAFFLYKYRCYAPRKIHLPQYPLIRRAPYYGDARAEL